MPRVRGDCKCHPISTVCTCHSLRALLCADPTGQLTLLSPVPAHPSPSSAAPCLKGRCHPAPPCHSHTCHAVVDTSLHCGGRPNRFTPVYTCALSPPLDYKFKAGGMHLPLLWYLLMSPAGAQAPTWQFLQEGIQCVSHSDWPRTVLAHWMPLLAVGAPAALHIPAWAECWARQEDTLFCR